MHETSTPEEPLSSLHLSPADVAALPAKTRNALIGYLLRWEHYQTARRCLEALLVTHGHLVYIHDSMARAHLGLDEADLAVEAMRRRHALRSSDSSQALAARAHLAAQ